MVGSYDWRSVAGLAIWAQVWLVIIGWAASSAGQDQLGPPYALQPDVNGIIDSQRGTGGQLIDDGLPAPPRFAEPELPPIDYWQPTWMPCQSLRTNRSLVLGHLYFGMDLMGWSTKGVHAPALVNVNGVTAFGNEFVHNDMRPGGKLTLGWWFDPNQYSGIEWNYFELDGHDLRFADQSGVGGQLLTRPITNANTGLPGAVLISDGVTQTGSIDLTSNLQLTSTSILYRKLFWANEVARLDYLAGYRHAHLFDSLVTNESLTILQAGGGFLANDTVTRQDNLRSITQFDGADLGVRGWWSNNGTLAVTGLAKFAVGATNKTVLVDGQTRLRRGNNTTTFDGRGVLALPSNAGRYVDQDLSLVSEIGVGLEWQPICFWKFSLGYTWFYWSDVVRTMNQVDTTIDPNQLAPNLAVGARPVLNLETSSFWAQGLNAGLSYQF